jgi:hypothetical protein
MADLDFPDNPVLNECFISFGRVFKFSGSEWALVISEPPDSGLIDCNVNSDHDILFQGGASLSNFSGFKSIDCGEI